MYFSWDHYHLISTQASKKATLEALRYLKPGGYLYVSFIMFFAGMIYYMKHDPEGVLTDPSYEIYIDTCLSEQDKYKKLLDMFNISCE
jgi:Ni,Fe-hydrogenase I cytochrome b subunit